MAAHREGERPALEEKAGQVKEADKETESTELSDEDLEKVAGGVRVAVFKKHPPDSSSDT